jgi:PAS domain S-box-containing protein
LHFFGSLRGKFIGYTLVTGTFFMSLFFLVMVFTNRARTMQRFEFQATQMGELVEDWLEHEMLEGNQTTVLEVMSSLSSQPYLKGVYVLNKEGYVKFSSDGSSVGKHFDIHDATCQICHQVKPALRSKSTIFRKGSGRVFRTVTPLVNKVQCHSCHGSSQKINGVLIADFSMLPFDREVNKNLLTMVVGIIITILGSAIVIWIMFERLIMRRLKRFLDRVRQISLGDLSGHIVISDQDEITELEQSFNIMSENLEHSITEVEDSRDSLENLINSIEDEIMVIDKDFRIVSLNHGALHRLGVQKKQVLGRLCHDVCYDKPEPCASSERDCPVRETLKSGLSYSTSRSFMFGRELRHFEQYVSPIRNSEGQIDQVVKISRDVTRRRRLESQLAQSERLIALGQLAAGVAHQVNNPIGVIVNRIDCLKREGKIDQLPESVKSDLDVMKECAWRVSSIARSLLTFSREAPLLLEPVDVNKAIQMAVGMAQMQRVKKNVSIEVNLQPELPLVKGDLNKLEQCIVNILNNAMDAIPDKGHVRVESALSSKNDKRIVIRISDSGIGIASEDLPKIFDPFFTTKPVGKGTGLGLSISYGIIKEHGGTLKVSSIPKEGTTFTICLPVLDGQQDNDRYNKQ